MTLRARALGMAVGIVWGIIVFVATLWMFWFGQPSPTWPTLMALYPGYDVSYGGAFIGLVWGFIDGFITGALVAWLYNKFHKAFYKSEPAR